MSGRVEVVEFRRRRRWTVEETLRIVAECEAPGAEPADVARRYDISTGLLYTCKRMVEGRLPRVAEPVTLLPVHVSEPVALPPLRGRPPQAARLEIGLPGGIKLKVDTGVDPEALAAIVGVLQRR